MRNSDLRPDHATGSRSVIIVGVPRSGTSMAAAVFARRGYFCGRIRQDRLREGDHHNPFGYFEADDLVERNVLVLARAGFGFHNTWVFDRISAEQIDRIRELDPSKDDQDFLAGFPTNAGSQPSLSGTPRSPNTRPAARGRPASGLSNVATRTMGIDVLHVADESFEAVTSRLVESVRVTVSMWSPQSV